MMTDEELIARFEAGRLDGLPHADHLRLGLLYLARDDRAEAVRRLADGLLLFATMKRHPEKFHVTMTRAWLELLDAARATQPGSSPSDVIAAWPGLLDPKALRQFYSAERLDGDEARTSWVEPDLAPLGVAALR